MEKATSSGHVRPRIIIHGGAGNINRSNLPPEAYKAYRSALLGILRSSSTLLALPGATALDVATYAVSELENNALLNSGHGAVFTRSGTHELEASIMCSRGYQKRGVGIMKLNRVKNPIKLAREMLVRGNEADGGGAAGHCQLEGESMHKLAEDWGLDMVSPSYFWSKKRWDEHRRGLGKSTDSSIYEKHKKLADRCVTPDEPKHLDSDVDVDVDRPHDPSWNGKDYLPQGTVGCVVLDSTGTLCVATSTGGITNKLPGRIGDTPTLGAGFWSEEWMPGDPFDEPHGLVRQPTPSPLERLLGGDIAGVLADCLPSFSSYLPLAQVDEVAATKSYPHGVAMSGTGNGDSFLRLSAVRTAAAMTRFSSPPKPLQWSVTRMAGPEGMLQQSAGDRWHKTGEGEGGIIGIEFSSGRGTIVADFCCGGMFRAWVDDQGKEQMMVLRDEY